MSQPKAPITPVLIVFLSIAAFIAVIWFSLTATPTGTTSIGWKSYTNLDYGFHLEYPALLKAKIQNTPDEHTPLYITFSPIIQSGSVAAGVDELTLSVEDQSIEEFRTGQESLLTVITVDGKTGYKSKVQQGIEGLYQFVYIPLGEQTLSLVASGKRIALLAHMISSFRYVKVQTACTDEAKICPDGSAVGRTGPNCEFAACPVTNSNTNSTNTNSSATIEDGCYVGGCSSEICSDQPDAVSDCIAKPEYVCYKTAHCTKTATGKCGWESTPTLNTCLNDHTAPVFE